MDPTLEIQEPDEARPAKRVRLDAPLEITEQVQDEMGDEDDDWDDVYGEQESVRRENVQQSVNEPSVPDLISAATQAQQTNSPEDASLPAPAPPPVPADGNTQIDDEARAGGQMEMEDGVPPEAVDEGEELIDEHHGGSTAEEPAVRIMEETSGINGDPNVNIDTLDARGGATMEHEDGELDGQEIQINGGTGEIVPGAEHTTTTTVTQDADFLAAATAQKGNEVAEWQFDSSDAESSSDDSDGDTSDDSDSDSEGGYEMLDAATAAKILMAGDGDDGDDKKPLNGDHQPRTTNEQKEVVVPKPDVVVTEGMKITLLGTVERTLQSTVLIKAATSGSYQVLESGSVLCNASRTVIGAVAETLGRVQEPMYSVNFTNAAEIEQAGLSFGTEVYYVDEHSSFVFTQPLKAFKGTDASNIHDEEVGEEEMEFSDDEAEAEFKRMKKLAKRGGRGGLASGGRGGRGGMSSFGAPGDYRCGDGMYAPGHGDAPPPSSHGGSAAGGGLSYDDDDNGEPAVEEFYKPLRRPENLSEMMAGGAPPPPSHMSRPPPPHSGFERGRGRGRGDRGRGDRGRGRGRGGRGGFQHDRGRDQGQRGGFRGGAQANGNAQQGHRGNAQSFPDRHNNDRGNVNGFSGRNQQQQQQQHSLPPRPRVSAAGSPPPSSFAPQYPPQNNNYQQQPHGFPQPPQQQTYQFNGYNFQYGASPPPPPPQASQAQAAYYQQPPPPTPGGSIPPGAFVNPAFFQNQQQQQQQPGYATGWSQYAQPPGPANGGQQMPQGNLADILRNLGGRRPGQ